MSVRIIILGLLVFSSCTNIARRDSNRCEHNYRWIRVEGEAGSAKDTISFCQKISLKNDSIIIECKTDSSNYSDSFIFSRSNKTSAFYNGGPRSKRLYVDGKVINTPNKMLFDFVADTVIAVGQTNFSVCKYHFDMENTYDIGCDYYWVPDIGIVYFSSSSWNIGYKLYTNDSSKDKAITGIISAIQHL